MKKIFLFILALPHLTFGQSLRSQITEDLTKIYTQAIADFITAANTKNLLKNDTLFFGKRNNKQLDDFPAIELPDLIENKHIILTSSEDYTLKQNNCKTCIYINLIGWVEFNKAEFLFYVFSNGFEHQFNYSIKYGYNALSKEFKLEMIEFKGPPFINK